MQVITDIAQINLQQWEQLIEESPTATWFQTLEAYHFYASVPDILTPFVVACRDDVVHRLKGVIVGYVTKEQNPIKQFFSRRAIILGGPLLAKDITEEELTVLLNAIRNFEPLNIQTFKPIYLEMRNFNSFVQWKEIFEACGFAYQPHLNFHVDTSLESLEANISKARRRDIVSSFEQGVEILEHPSLEQVRDYYDILVELYRTKIKTPLFPWAFFEALYHIKSAIFLLVKKDGVIIGGGTYVSLAGRTCYAWWGGGKSHLPKGIHPLFVANYEAMRYAANHDMPLFDMMGAGKPNEQYGVRESKKQFGGTLVEHGRFLYICKPILYRIGTLVIHILKASAQC